MFDWLKNKVGGGSSDLKVAEALRKHFKLLEVDGTRENLADRLTGFVLTGEAEEVIAELAAMQNTTHVFMTSIVYFGAVPAEPRLSLASLLRLLPEDADVFLRLAKVYDAANHATAIQHYPGSSIPAFKGALSWLATFLIQLSDHGKEHSPVFPASHVTAMIAASGEDPSLLVSGPFFYEDAQGKSQVSRWTNTPYSHFHCLEGFPELVLSSTEIVRPAFSQKDAGSRAAVLRALDSLKINPDPFTQEIALLAVSGSKEVREAAAPLITSRFSLFKSLLESHAEKGSSDERYHAVRLLARIGGAESRAFLSSRLNTEKASKVADALKEALADPVTSQHSGGVGDFELPEIPEVSPNAPLDKKVLEDLRARVAEAERTVAQQFAHNQFAKNAGWTRTPVAPETADRLYEALQNFVVTKDSRFPYFLDSQAVDNQLLFNYPVPLEFELIHLLRWCLLLSAGPNGTVGVIDTALNYRWRTVTLTYQRIHKKEIDLRQFAAVHRAVGLPDDVIGRQILESNRYFSSPFINADPNKVWPYFAERPELLDEAFCFIKKEEKQPYANLWESEKRQNAFNVLKGFPRPPARYLSMLWDIALGSSKTERPLAQECLAAVPNKEEKIVAALSSRQQDARQSAAQWLGQLNYKEAIPALKTALTKEKSEGVKDELIKTLEMLGVKLEELLDRDKLDQEAEKGLKKGIPKDLEWFPFAQLPSVTWEDSGKPVGTEIIHWFLLQGFKLKNAEANPTLRRYFSLIRKDEREKLGRFVMEAWIAEDTKPKYTPEQAASKAQLEAQQIASYASHYPQYYPNFDQERAYQTAYNRFLTEPEGSQTATKGILAVAGACCGADAAPIVHRYVKQWYGYRSAQCKALLQVLAWIEHPSATQVVLSVANRFRTKGIQEEAMRLCQLLADRKGWTLDELSDRTIPTVGFDETGNMELDFGPRMFGATLSEDMSIVVTNPDGKTIASLPDPNQSDDPEKAKASKAALSTARKELKTILTMQKDRFYEALCTQRMWRFDDWDAHLRQHPIVGRYCQRLIWVAYDNDQRMESFRPLADGTLTNNQDDEVTLKPETGVRLAHDETLPREDCSAWLQHFSDYKVDPLFQQFGKTTFSLPDEMKDTTEIREFLGHIVKSFSLRNRLTRLGYTRGAAQDAGWFYDYRKTFLTLGIKAIIEFTGNPLPEVNRTVALQRLYFVRKSDEAEYSMNEALTLGELPRVLLSECWNDIRMAAAEGSGFADDWEKQTEY